MGEKMTEGTVGQKMQNETLGDTEMEKQGN